MLWDTRKSTVKELKDFPTNSLYTIYVKANSKEGTTVQCTKSHDGVDVGKLGTVRENSGTKLWVSWYDKKEDVITNTITNTRYANVKLVYSPETDLPLAN